MLLAPTSIYGVLAAVVSSGFALVIKIPTECRMYGQKASKANK